MGLRADRLWAGAALTVEGQSMGSRLGKKSPQKPSPEPL